MSKPVIETCLVCGKPPEVGPLRKGLCRADYEKYLRAKKAAENEGIDVEAWESDLVRQGVLLADGRAKSNVFADTLAKFRQTKAIPLPKPTSPESMAVAESTADEYEKSVQDAVRTAKKAAKTSTAKQKQPRKRKNG